MWEKDEFSKRGGKPGRDFSFEGPIGDTPEDLKVTEVLTISREERWDEPIEYIIVRPGTRSSVSGQSSIER